MQRVDDVNPPRPLSVPSPPVKYDGTLKQLLYKHSDASEVSFHCRFNGS